MKKLTINKTKVKDTALFAYVALTLMGLYSAAMFYAGTQYVHADNQTIVIHQSKK